MNRRILGIIGLIAALLSPAGIAAQAGATASLGGVVVDADGQPVVAAEVRLRYIASGMVALTLSDVQGRYRLTNLRPGGPYVIQVERLGYRSAQTEDVRLLAGEHQWVDLVLQPFAVMLEGVEVVTRPGIRLSPSRMGVAHISDAETITLFPTIRRDVLSLAEASPLVHREGSRLSVAGQNDRLNAIQLDGLLLQDPSGFPRGDLPEPRRKFVPMEALEQFRVAASPFDIRETGFQGGLLQAVTRSGTNQWLISAMAHGRYHGLLGALDVDGARVPARDFQKMLAGVTLGGPIRRDRTHLFLALEVEEERRPPQGLNIGEADPLRLQIIPDSVVRAVQILADRFGVDAGTEEAFPLASPMANLYLRLDHIPSENRSLTWRHLSAWSEEDLSPNRGPLGAYGMSAASVPWAHRSILNGVEFIVRGRSGWGNRILVQHQQTRDIAGASTGLPQIDIRVWGTYENYFLNRYLRAGNDAAAHGLELSQDLLEIKNEFSRSLGRHHVSVGASARTFAVRHLHMPGSRGIYTFDNLWDLAGNAPFTYEVLYLPDGVTDPSERFSLREWSLYVQDEWEPHPNLNIRAGIRADWMQLPRRPDANPALAETMGVDNTRMPGGLAVSPRVGFNWHGRVVGGLTQISGGFGVFQGRIPFEWIASTYAYTGTRRAQLICQQNPEINLRVAPRLVVGRGVPTECEPTTFGRTAVPPVVQFMDEDLTPPRDVKLALSVDRELPLGLGFTVEGLYSRALKQLFLEDRNLPTPVSEPGPDQRWDGLGPRVRFGDVFGPYRRAHPAWGPVVQVGNRRGDHSLSFLGALSGSLGSRYAFDLGYRFTQAVTLQTLTSADAISSFGRNPVSISPNEPGLRPSPFLRPHTVTASLTMRVPDPWGETAIGLRFKGLSGRPFSFVYMGDGNGDGFSGLGLGREVYNDLLYIPMGTTSAETPWTTPVTRALLHRFIGMTDCLESSRGRILERGDCRRPWYKQLDLKAVRHIPTSRGTLQLQADLVNALNVFNRRWGRVEDVPPQLAILRFTAFPPLREGMNPEHGLSYVGPVTRTPEGDVWPLQPLTVDPIASRWQAQVGIHFTFGSRER